MLSGLDLRHRSERTALFNCMQCKDNYIDLYWHDGFLRSRKPDHPQDPLRVHVPEIEDFVDRIAERMGARQEALDFEVINRNASSHFIGGMIIGTNRENGVIDPYLRAFGQPGLHIIDGSVMPANPGVNPTLTITAMAERAMSFWPAAAFYLEDTKQRIAVIRADDEYFAVDDLCPRDDCSLASGRLDGDHLIMCPCGGCRFDVRTGAVVRGPATESLRSYPIREVDGAFEVAN